MEPDGARTTHGRRLKEKGARTRRRILQALEDAVRTTPLQQLRVTDIAERAGMSAQNFYSYFDSLDDALLALLQERTTTHAELMELLRAPWPPSEELAYARRFVSAYFVYREANLALFRLRDLRVGEGAERFAAARAQVVRPVLQAVAAKIAAARGETSSAPAAALAAVMVDAIEGHGPSDSATSRAGREDRMEALAQMLADWVSLSGHTGWKAANGAK